MPAHTGQVVQRIGIMYGALLLGAALGWGIGWAIDAGYFTGWQKVTTQVPAQTIVDVGQVKLGYRGVDNALYLCTFVLPYCPPYSQTREPVPRDAVLSDCPTRSPAYSFTARKWFTMTQCVQYRGEMSTWLAAVDDRQQLWYWAYRQPTGHEGMRPLAAALGTLLFGGLILWAYERWTRRAALRRRGLAR